MSTPLAMIAIPIFRIRISLIQPGMISIYNPIRPLSLQAQLTTFQRESWILKAHRGSNPAKST
jgi:hypothetical protein